MRPIKPSTTGDFSLDSEPQGKLREAFWHGQSRQSHMSSSACKKALSWEAPRVHFNVMDKAGHWRVGYDAYV
ncbi:hypothetical protein Mapa_002711 [Marchantia paleacea]|nr:hypothetical protein Mapa_002711 [Marchantia paleacea]